MQATAQLYSNYTTTPVNRIARHNNFGLAGARFKEVELSGQSWSIYDNANLSVHVTEKCNADCQFCVAHLRYLQDGSVYYKPEISSTEIYLEGLTRSLEAVQAVNPSVSITGGEPTVNKRLPAILRTIAKTGARKRTLTTNASGLGWKVEGGSDTVLDRLAEYRLEHLNISRAHDDFATNCRIMKMAPHLLSDAQLREYIATARYCGIRVRLSCALLKEGISTVDDMMRYIDWAADLGVDNVIFRQLMNFSREAKGAIPRYSNAQSVPLQPIWEELDRRDQMQVYHTVLGYYYYVEVRKYGSLDIASEAADLNLIEPQLDKFSKQRGKPVAFEMVYHPNGNLCAGWREERNIMLEAANEPR
jgi:GTP 3',8-cyclase